MFKTEKIELLIKYALLTGFIEGDVPTSVMLISPPEHAKTSIIRGIKCPGTVETSDISPKTLTDKLIPMIFHEKIHHLVVPDLVKPLSHKAATVDSTIAFLNAGIEEGIQNQMFFGQELNLPSPARFGMITSVTPDFFIKFFKKWNDIGFMTRFMPVSYSYSEATKTEIHELIKRNELQTIYSKIYNANNGMHKKFWTKKIPVEIPDNEASYMALQSQDIAKKLETYHVKIFTQGGGSYLAAPKLTGFRLQRQLRMLASAIAISRNRSTVNFSDLEELKKVLDFIGYPNNAVEI